ncbi:hypothetical protein N0V93_005711 [Gnomoniopsis smithogilvyi]|uniref:Chromosome condensation protein n=1 Tax=Gnomoniopsis smithogilvyi TaxID=1191159 RepID=A0A9W9CY98_9PEZI|nr:hypothetical protein N0V93_005711 [Gnomoniopsis smithogilvyi]
MEWRNEERKALRDNVIPLHTVHSAGSRHSAAHHSTRESTSETQRPRANSSARRDVTTADGTPPSYESPRSRRARSQTQASQESGPRPYPYLPPSQERARGTDSQGLDRPLQNPDTWNSPRESQKSSAGYDAPQNFLFLDEVADPGPVRDPDEEQYPTLEGAREDEETGSSQQDAQRKEQSAQEHSQQKARVSRWTTQLYTLSHLILFSFLGTLARLGLQALTKYPGAPVFPSVWFNFGGSVVMGFLAEDRKLFREEWGTPTYDNQIRRAKRDAEESGLNTAVVDLAAAKKTHLAVKKSIPLYIGLTTGFCGSFTSFSSFIRDIFLALSNDLPQPDATTTVRRNGGYSFMAMMAIIIITVTVSLSGLYLGAHIALLFEPFTPTLPFYFSRKVMDRLGVFLGWGCWIGAVLLTAMPPHNFWRGDATFALVFAPVGTLTRFYAALWFNKWKPSFPLGTFAVNVFGTAILGMAWDLQRVPVGGVLTCQVLQGIEDGLCGCLTTVSTWVSELSALRRKHAWIYGSASVLISFGVMVLIMGGLRWTDGFAELKCAH